MALPDSRYSQPTRSVPTVLLVPLDKTSTPVDGIRPAIVRALPELSLSVDHPDPWLRIHDGLFSWFAGYK